jgi:hypothetical protein
VRQTETAALKAVGDNKQGPFLRELKNLYTKGTFIEEMVTADIEEESGASTGSGSNYLMCIVEENRGGGGPDERVRVGIVVRCNIISATKCNIMLIVISRLCNQRLVILSMTRSKTHICAVNWRLEFCTFSPVNCYCLRR